MATKPYFLWGDNTRADAPDPDVVAVFAGATSSAQDAALAPPDLGPAAAVARPWLRRNSAAGSAGKQQQQQGGGPKKPPQRGLGVAELERLRCGGDPLRELSAVVLGDAAAQGHPLLHYHRHHMQVPAASAFEPAPAPGAARYCSQLLAPAPPPAAAAGLVSFLHPHAAAASGCQRAAALLPAPEQHYFRDRWTRMGSTFSMAAGGGAAADHQSQLLIPAPEHPSSQSTIWRPAASSCLHTGHRCDICSRRMKAMAERGALAPAPAAPTPPASPKAADATADTVPDYSIYDLATAMATARQGDAFWARERKRGAADADAPARKEVREIEFFPAASAHQTGGGRVPVPHESEFAAHFYSSPSPYGGAASHSAPAQLDLSLKL